MARLHIPLLAVDGGGTKCLAVLMDTKGTLLGQGRAGSCNYQGVGREAAIKELTLGIQSAISDLSERNGTLEELTGIDIECAVIGIAGLDTAYDRSIILELVRKALEPLPLHVRQLVVENDGFAALAGATDGSPGVLVIAGTGSIVFGINDEGLTARAGGWGHRVGDEGSGYWIGKQAIMAALRAYDGRGEATQLGDWIVPHLGLRDEEELFNWTYGSDYAVEKVGELSRLVSQAAAAGDDRAKHILAMAAEELFQGIRAVVDRLGMKHKPFQLILQGGVLQNDGLVRQMLTHKFENLAPFARLDHARGEPINGVTAMGLSLLNSAARKEAES
ncbi:N-acetylglucosamine kinase [Paenibacillus sp. UNC451MF]|uniref:N-acetylglucosamine kinase n=1 Tax=Paenibacillus sp. UNC451MF TaxID=1449063 RepID=UPI00048C0F56|nr:BadF/BadG/BcrA/BcrD ATPase family protein [Paenibacillus sp. UNC451MF]